MTRISPPPPSPPYITSLFPNPPLYSFLHTLSIIFVIFATSPFQLFQYTKHLIRNHGIKEDVVFTLTPCLLTIPKIEEFMLLKLGFALCHGSTHNPRVLFLEENNTSNIDGTSSFFLGSNKKIGIRSKVQITWIYRGRRQ